MVALITAIGGITIFNTGIINANKMIPPKLNAPIRILFKARRCSEIMPLHFPEDKQNTPY